MSIENVIIEVPAVAGQTASETLQAAASSVVDIASDMSHKAVEVTSKAGGFFSSMAKNAAGVVTNVVKEHKTVVVATAAVAGVAAAGTIGYKYFKNKRAEKQAAEAAAAAQVKAKVSVNDDGSVDLGADLG